MQAGIYIFCKLPNLIFVQNPTILHSSLLRLLIVSAFFFLTEILDAQVMLIPAGAQWKYSTQITDNNAIWRLPQFDDSTWEQGFAQFGFGDGDEQTVLSGSWLTAYFRKSFPVQGAATLAGILLKIKRDDGIVVYVNGVEQFRNNMPEGTPTSQTPASSIAMNDGTGWIYCPISSGILHEGLNYLAAEVHNLSADDSDLSFDAELTATQLDSTIPNPIEFTPAAESIEVNPQNTCAITFNESIRLHTGKAILSTAETPIFTIDIPDEANISNNSTLILPFPVLPSGTQLRVSILPNSISDLAGNFYADTLQWSFNTSCTSIGCFESVIPQAQAPYLIIPASHRFQVLRQSGDALNSSKQYPENPDFTGYFEAQEQAMPSLLCVNHEGYPSGNISISALQLNDSLLWEVLPGSLVDFTALGGTMRNCSGAITPWGTMLSGEEVRHFMGDSTGDGYQDSGWMVEVDPQTGTICEYASGSAQKIWAMGRMAHENAVISPIDQQTAYYGEDMADGCLYKFLANEPGNLSSGELFVLKLDSTFSQGIPTAQTGIWIPVPNASIEERNTTFQLATQLGGTMFNGIEDVEISPDGLIYFASKNFGRIYRFKDNGNVISGFEVFAGGTSYPIRIGADTVWEDWSYGNDNLAFDGDGNLWVLQDGGRNHIWLIRNGHSQAKPRVELFATTPAGCEPTGITFSPNFRYLFLSLQHPNSTNIEQPDASGRMFKLNRSSTLVIARSEFLGNAPFDTTFTGSNNENGFFAQALPQPFFENLFIEIDIAESQIFRLTLIASDGRLLHQQDLQTFSGRNIYQLALPRYEGISSLNIHNENHSKSLKIISIEP